MGHFFTWPPGPSAMRLTTHTGSYVARTVPVNKSKEPQHPLTAWQPYRTYAAPSGEPGTTETPTDRRPLRTYASPSDDLSGMWSPGSDQQIGGIEGLCRSASTTWGHQRSNRLATLVDLRRSVRPVGVILPQETPTDRRH